MPGGGRGGDGVTRPQYDEEGHRLNPVYDAGGYNVDREFRCTDGLCGATDCTRCGSGEGDGTACDTCGSPADEPCATGCPTRGDDDRDADSHPAGCACVGTR